MTNRSIFLAVASVAVLAFAGSASAQDSGLYGSINIGATDVGSTNAFNLSPSGTVVDLRVGDVLYNGDFTVAVEAGAMLGEVAAERVIPTCTFGICGYDEFDTEHRQVDWSGSFGLRVGHSFGPVTAYVTGGVRIAKMTESSSYDSGGVYPTWKYEQTGYVVGTYVGAGLSYPLGDRFSATLAYERSNLTRMSWSSTWGSGTTGFEQETLTAGLVWAFK